MSEFTDYFFRTQDGLRLYVRDYAGPDDAPVVLCLHGLTRNSRDFQELAPALSEHFRVLVPEQRGRGRSDYDDDVSRYALLQYVDDMRGLLSDLGIEHVAIVGTSMGGLMTFALNALYPGLVTRAVINDIGKRDTRAVGMFSSGLEHLCCAFENLLVTDNAGVIKRELHGAVSFL